MYRGAGHGVFHFVANNSDDAVHQSTFVTSSPTSCVCDIFDDKNRRRRRQ